MKRDQQSAKAAAAVHLPSIAKVVIVSGLISLAMVATLSYLHFEEDVSVYRFISDPAPFVGMPWYFGSLSHAGVLLWIASASVSAFAAAVLWKSQDYAGRRLSRLLALLSLATFWMAIDDLLLVHEQLGQLLLGRESRHSGEALIFGSYALALLVIFIRYRGTVARTEILLLGAVLVSLGASVAIDIVLRLDMGGGNPFLEAVLARSWGEPMTDIIEDVLKLNGGILLLAYLFRTGYIAILQETVPAGASVNTAQDQELSPESRKLRRWGRRSF